MNQTGKLVHGPTLFNEYMPKQYTHEVSTLEMLNSGIQRVFTKSQFDGFFPRADSTQIHGFARSRGGEQVMIAIDFMDIPSTPTDALVFCVDKIRNALL